MPAPDPKGFLTVLENELLVAGFDIAPVESASSVAESARIAQAEADYGRVRIGEQTEVTTGIRVPSRVGISLTYTYVEYPAATYFTRAFIRIIDLSDQRVLASFRADGSELRPLRMDRIIRDFVTQLQARDR